MTKESELGLVQEAKVKRAEEKLARDIQTAIYNITDTLGTSIPRGGKVASQDFQSDAIGRYRIKSYYSWEVNHVSELCVLSFQAEGFNRSLVLRNQLGKSPEVVDMTVDAYLDCYFDTMRGFNQGERHAAVNLRQATMQDFEHFQELVDVFANSMTRSEGVIGGHAIHA